MIRPVLAVDGILPDRCFSSISGVPATALLSVGDCMLTHELTKFFYGVEISEGSYCELELIWLS